MHVTDRQLLELYQHGDADAFGQLVARHADWVYSAAMRRAGTADLAQDITQAVFIALAKRPPRTLSNGTLSPWLFGVLIRTCKAAMRAASTRRRHETEAGKMRQEAIESSDHADWADISTVLEDSLHRLKTPDREAVLLRFYEQMSFSDIGNALGMNEEAARKRVSRALEKLRAMLSGKGVSMPAGALGALLIAEIVRAAPPKLVAAMHNPAAMNYFPAANNLAKAVAQKHFVTTAVPMLLVSILAICGVFMLMQRGGDTTTSLPLSAMPTAAATAPTSQAFDAAIAKAGVLARWKALQNLSATYHSESSSDRSGLPSPIPGAGTDSGIARGGTGGIQLSIDQTLGFLNGLVRLEAARDIVEPGVKPGKLINITYHHGNTTETLTHRLDSDSKPLGSISHIGTLQSPLLIALGLARFEPDPSSILDSILSIEDIDKMELSAAGNGRVAMKRITDVGNDEWELNPTAGYVVTSYRFKGVGRNIAMEAGDFRTVGGILLPFSVKQTMGGALNPSFSSGTGIALKQYAIGSRENIEDNYKVNWPEGAQIAVDSGRVNFVAGRDGHLISLDAIALEKFKARVRLAATQPSDTGTRFAEPKLGITLRIANSRLDLETGSARVPPFGKQINYDLWFDSQGGVVYQIGGPGLFLFKLAPKAWDEKSVASVKDAIRDGDPHITVFPQDDSSVCRYLFPPGGLELPLVFAYRNRDGHMGMLRLSELNTVNASVDWMPIERTDSNVSK